MGVRQLQGEVLTDPLSAGAGLPVEPLGPVPGSATTGTRSCWPGNTGGSALPRCNLAPRAQFTSARRRSAAESASSTGNHRAPASAGTAANSTARCASTVTVTGSTCPCETDAPASSVAAGPSATGPSATGAQPAAPGVTAKTTCTGAGATSASRFNSAAVNAWSAAITKSSAPARPTESSSTRLPAMPSAPVSGVSIRLKCRSSGSGTLSSTRRGGRASAGPAASRSAP
ncbi:hypothetical protein GCM10027614_62830 [Micromonospora vulcania]